MINITIICVGKLKEPYFQAGVTEYIKRIGKYAKLDVVELPDEKTPALESESNVLKTLDLEGEAILAKLPKDGFVVTLEIEGELMSSEALASFIDKTTQFQSNRIVFIIGGSLGLSDKVKKRANFALSFSKMTFPHQLMRLMLVEQLYRSLSILNHSSYHK